MGSLPLRLRWQQPLSEGTLMRWLRRSARPTPARRLIGSDRARRCREHQNACDCQGEDSQNSSNRSSSNSLEFPVLGEKHFALLSARVMTGASSGALGKGVTQFNVCRDA